MTTTYTDTDFDQALKAKHRALWASGDTTCCLATQDKVWVSGPAGEQWEVYTVLADAEEFGTSPELLAADPAGGCACDTAERADTEPSGTTPHRPATATACC